MQMSNGLFRENAVKHQSAKLDGEVNIAQPLSSQILLLSLLIVVVLLAFFLFNADFNRKETVQGYLKPQSGLTKVLSPRAGIIKQILVENGQDVEKGQALMLLQSTTLLADGRSLSQLLHVEVVEQINSVAARKLELAEQQNIRRDSYEKQIAFHKQEVVENDKQQQILTTRFSLQQSQLSRLRVLAQNGAVTRSEIQAQEDAVLSLQQQLSALSSQRQQLLQQINQVSSQLEQLPSENLQQLALLDAEHSRLLQRQSEVASSDELLIVATNAGRITNLRHSIGQSISAQVPVATILPKDMPLKAVLLVPTRAFGFVEKGQQTRLRFDAFPHQRFGLFGGQIVEVARHIVLPGELVLPVNIQEPVYPVEVALSTQAVKAYGKSMNLQSGMLLNADIVLEQRSLISWLFEPITSLKGRL
ncbi:HlyD family efflux transporter periplasmic adaptor subunit [Agaribacter flavus]|uniref:HlyD family efflux transporter periplasmic adaptor subunit n=1 Tax=Agaribacter flavus TaxID=1902781 RepID=A0ABV7FS11_9ALTE